MENKYLLKIFTKDGCITVLTDQKHRSSLSSYIMETINNGNLCIFKDNDSVPHVVCKGNRITGFQFDLIDVKAIQQKEQREKEYLESATRYFQNMNQGEDWKYPKED